MSLHIEAKPGDIADRILLPGDPLRAKYIAETFLDHPVCYNHIRNIFCTGNGHGNSFHFYLCYGINARLWRKKINSRRNMWRHA